MSSNWWLNISKEISQSRKRQTRRSTLYRTRDFDITFAEQWLNILPRVSQSITQTINDTVSDITFCKNNAGCDWFCFWFWAEHFNRNLPVNKFRIGRFPHNSYWRTIFAYQHHQHTLLWPGFVLLFVLSWRLNISYENTKSPTQEDSTSTISTQSCTISNVLVEFGRIILFYWNYCFYALSFLQPLV